MLTAHLYSVNRRKSPSRRCYASNLCSYFAYWISCTFVFSAMEELLAELRVFLELLDREYLTAGVREKKQQILNILHRVLATRGKLKHFTFDFRWTLHTAPCCFIIMTHVYLISTSIYFSLWMCLFFSQSLHVRPRYTPLSRPHLRCPYQRFLTPGW